MWDVGSLCLEGSYEQGARIYRPTRRHSRDDRSVLANVAPTNCSLSLTTTTTYPHPCVLKNTRAENNQKKKASAMAGGFRALKWLRARHMVTTIEDNTSIMGWKQ